jgi:sulfoxide reductase catalytic subunit YedY
MILRVKRPSDLGYSEVTPEHVYRSRREFLTTASAAALGLAAGARLRAQAPTNLPALSATRNAQFVAADRVNSYDHITSSTSTVRDGSDPAENAHTLKVKPWIVKVDG